MLRWPRVGAASRLGIVGLLLLAPVAAPVHAVAAAPPRGVPAPPVSVAPQSAPKTARIIIGKNAMVRGFRTRTVHLATGGKLTVVSRDVSAHTVTSRAKDTNGDPLFDVYMRPKGRVVIKRAAQLVAGRYPFYCKFHPSMTGVLIVTGPGGTLRPAGQRFDQPLVLPRVLTDAHPTIHVRRAAVRVLPYGPRTVMWTYNGSYPGPTIRRPAGQDTKVTFVNDLPASAGALTVHLHGDHHASVNDGQPASQLIPPGGRRTYDYPLIENGRPVRAAVDFYHDHRMGRTGRNIWNGLQGMFLIDDPREARLHLPSGRYDVPLLISDRSFTANNQLTHPFAPAHNGMAMPMTEPPGDATVGNHVLVNGRYAPYLNVSTHRYRLRLVNGSNFQSYTFALSDGRNFVQVGTGSGLLPRPVRRHSILLGPAQRADVVVNFGGEFRRNVVLKSIARPDRPKLGIGTPRVAIMQFRVRTRTIDRSRVPKTLEAPPPITVPTTVAQTWNFGLGGDATTGRYWTINGRPYDPTRVDYEVPLGATQLWRLHNSSNITHYVHLHEEQWHTIRRDGHEPPPWERGLEDTWRLDPGETVEVAARFTDYTGVFMIHCHMLDHEDDGMMATFAVVRHRGDTLPAGFQLAAMRLRPRPHHPQPHQLHPQPNRAIVAIEAQDGSHMTRRLIEIGGLEVLVVAGVIGLRCRQRSRRGRSAVSARRAR